MTDYGHDLLFGAFLTPSAEDPRRVLALAQLTEQVGLDLVTVQDHPYQARHLDAWTLLSMIAGRTSTIRLSPNVANLPLRPPVVLARSAASLDLLSEGRVELGLGAGAFWDAIAAVGGPRRDPAQAVDALTEAIEIIRAVWTVDRTSIRVDGEHYRVRGAHSGPAPAHDIGIWLGAYKPRMLGLTGRLADGWLPSSPYAGPAALPAMNRLIDEAAVAAGRRPENIRRLYNIGNEFEPEQLAELALTHGMSGFIAMGDDPDDIRRFAAEVAPAVRELVAAGRSGTPSGESTGPARKAVATTTPGRAQSPALPATPTPDDGVRRSDARLWDESTRPSGPAPDPDRVYTPHEQAAGRHLIDVHDHLRQELEGVRQLVEEVTAGSLDPGAARSQLNELTMRQNNWTLGAYCASYCRVVNTHHTIEDQSVFPHLRRRDPRLAPVIDRLEEEHRVIHEVLDGVDRALVAYVADPDGAKALRAVVDQLSDALLSHLSYEERELVEPLARLGFY
jgi:hemerythrin-like domain-containing protein